MEYSGRALPGMNRKTQKKRKREETEKRQGLGEALGRREDPGRAFPGMKRKSQKKRN
jgi:hypothetical protein